MYSLSAHPSLITLYEAFNGYIEYIQKHLSGKRRTKLLHVQTILRSGGGKRDARTFEYLYQYDRIGIGIFLFLAFYTGIQKVRADHTE